MTIACARVAKTTTARWQRQPEVDIDAGAVHQEKKIMCCLVGVLVYKFRSGHQGNSGGHGKGSSQMVRLRGRGEIGGINYIDKF